MRKGTHLHMCRLPVINLCMDAWFVCNRGHTDHWQVLCFGIRVRLLPTGVGWLLVEDRDLGFFFKLE